LKYERSITPTRRYVPVEVPVAHEPTYYSPQKTYVRRRAAPLMGDTLVYPSAIEESLVYENKNLYEKQLRQRQQLWHMEQENAIQDAELDTLAHQTAAQKHAINNLEFDNTIKSSTINELSSDNHRKTGMISQLDQENWVQQNEIAKLDRLNETQNSQIWDLENRNYRKKQRLQDLQQSASMLANAAGEEAMY